MGVGRGASGEKRVGRVESIRAGCWGESVTGGGALGPGGCGDVGMWGWGVVSGSKNAAWPVACRGMGQQDLFARSDRMKLTRVRRGVVGSVVAPWLLAAMALGVPTASALAQGSAPAQPKAPEAVPADTKGKQDAKPEAKDEAKIVHVKISTSMGDIYVELNGEKAPISVKNFLEYVDAGFYAKTLIHRVEPGFVIQGGGHHEDMTLKATRAPIKNEWNNGLKNDKYTLAMARTNQPDSATSQWYINLSNNAPLDRPQANGAAYAVFGKVVAGFDVVDKIGQVATGRNSVPVTPVVVTGASRVKASEVPSKGDGSDAKKDEKKEDGKKDDGKK